MIGGVWISCMSLEEVEMTLQEGENRVRIFDVSEGLGPSRENNQEPGKYFYKFLC